MEANLGKFKHYYAYYVAAGSKNALIRGLIKTF
jgi:hypothetical protein